jgi:hypothetical protein
LSAVTGSTRSGSETEPLAALDGVTRVRWTTRRDFAAPERFTGPERFVAPPSLTALERFEARGSGRFLARTALGPFFGASPARAEPVERRLRALAM